MNRSKSPKKLYGRICSMLSVKNMSILSLVLFIISLIPICCLSFVNRATGDDYGYGAFTRTAWMQTHSLTEVAKAIGVTISQYYDGWQGTWFSIGVFALQPEVFSDKAYVIVVFLMLFLWIGSTVLLFRKILKEVYGLDKWSLLLFLTVYLLLGMQFIPSTSSSIFWFNGCAHYMLPFAMCQAVVWCLICFIRKYQLRYLAGITILIALLGGSNYQAALFALIVLAYIGIASFLKEKDKRLFLLGIPLAVEMIGLVISMKAPGNKVRGGEEFGFSAGKAAVTIGKCFTEGIRTVVGYWQEKPIVFVGLAVLFLVILEAAKKAGNRENLYHPGIVAGALLCLFFAMQAPALYADVEVSGGVHNMNFLVFLLAAAGSLSVCAGRIAEKIKGSPDGIHRNAVIPGLFLCVILVAFLRSGLKSSTSWVSLEYIKSGQAADYKEQMDIQTAILTDEDVTDAVIPFVNDRQGPLMSMPATKDPTAWTNTVMKQFYGKNSVVGIPREEWEKLREDSAQ